MKKVVYGIVTEAQEVQTGCKCNFEYLKLYIQTTSNKDVKDYVDELQNVYSIKYAAFDILNEFKIPTQYGEYYENSKEY